MRPCVANAIAIAIVAAEDCMTAVRSIAQRAMRKTPDMCSALMRVKIADTSGFSRIGETPFDIMYSPRKTRPRPITVSPRLWTRSPRRKKYRTPPKARPMKPRS